MSDSVSDLSRARRWPGWGALSLTIGGLGAAFALAACCALPILLGALGLGTAWLFGVAELAAPHRSLLLIAGSASLLGGAVALWYQTRVVCAPNAWCARPAVRTLIAAGLVLGFLLLVLGYRYA